MRMKFRFIIISFSVVITILIIWFCFIPSHYDVPQFHKRAGTSYWLLNSGSRIGYYKIPSENSEQKAPIIYLHGGPGGLIKDEAIQALKPLAKAGFDIYLYDQVGSGHSSRLENISEYTVERHTSDLNEIIKIIGAEKIILLAHSWGCSLAMNYVQNYPGIAELLIMDGPGPILPINAEFIHKIPPDSLELKAPSSTNKQGNEKAFSARAKTIRIWAQLFGLKLASDEEADEYFTYLNHELSKSTFCESGQSTSLAGGGYYSHLMTVNDFKNVTEKRNQLSQISIPVLIIKGQCDNQRWGFTEEYLTLLPQSELVIVKNKGHEMLSEGAEIYTALITDFINKNSTH